MLKCFGRGCDGETDVVQRLEASKGHKRSWTHFVTLLCLHSVTTLSTDHHSLLSLEHWTLTTGPQLKICDATRGRYTQAIYKFCIAKENLKIQYFEKPESKFSDSRLTFHPCRPSVDWSFSRPTRCWLLPLTPHYCSDFFQIWKLYHRVCANKQSRIKNTQISWKLISINSLVAWCK